MRQTRDSIADIWGPRTPYQGEGEWPARVDERLAEPPDRWVQSCCVLCSNGCAMDIGVKEGRIVGVRGRAADRVNRGRLGPKGLHGWEANHSPDRLTRPLVRDNGRLREASWDEAMGRVVARCQQVVRDFTPGAVGIYNSGQLFHEEYYTLSVISHAGLGTSHLDGNTRLCTATASQALRETFGSDGQAGSYADLDVTDCLFLVGTNLAANQTVLWARVLDRRAGPRPPRLVVVDPRPTSTAREADVHLAPRLGTNVAVLNGILRLLLTAGYADRCFLAEHTLGLDQLEKTVAAYPPPRVREITGVPEAALEKAAELIGAAPTLVSAVLQGVYQSNQATAAACQVNNINLVLGKIGRPGCGVLQMNGQPTAQNTRETGCDGELPFFLNYQNPRHVERLAELWNVEALTIPHWHEHSHAMEIFRHVGLGTIKWLWVIATNPAVSLPELHRVRKALGKEGLFLVVQDAFLTETAELADVVLPAAIWGEKTGTFTNADRTVHISHKAVEPPGEARSDLDIFLDFARRMGFQDKDGAPLVKWSDAEGAFDHWARCSEDWLVDYSGLSYAKLTGGSGVPWPCNERWIDGCERIFTDLRFHTAADEAQAFGHDLETGAPREPDEYRAKDPAGRALLKPAHYVPPLEEPDAEYPFFLTTGRVVYHFHTRTKTGRCVELQQAAPEVFAEIAPADAARLGVAEGEMLEIASRRGTVRARARLADMLPGHTFLPFHYGHWDEGHPDDHRATNELTITGWDPVSKQPHFKYAAVQLRKAEAPGLGRRVADAASKALDRAKELVDHALSGAHLPRSRVSDYLGLCQGANEQFAAALRSLKAVHFEEAELVAGFESLARLSDESSAVLAPFAQKYGGHPAKEPKSLRDVLFPAARPGPFGVLRDLHALTVLGAEVQTATVVLIQTAMGLRDRELLDACLLADEHVKRQIAWALDHIKHRAPVTLIVPA